MMLPATLLTVSVLLVWHRPELAVIGFVAASLGYGLRSVLTQMRGYAESERLEALSQVDGLTGVANRRAFDAALERECGRARREGGALALAMIDIDHFKRLNDRFGHPEGDAALRAVAMALQGCARRGTDMIARYGGEEFAAILPGLNLVDAATQAERMRAAVEALGREAPVGVVTVSLGVSCGSDAGALLIAADKALYDAKESGRNRVGLR
jgi:diguanylate cyclase (GGDEF)-like protein